MQCLPQMSRQVCQPSGISGYMLTNVARTYHQWSLCLMEQLLVQHLILRYLQSLGYLFLQSIQLGFIFTIFYIETALFWVIHHGERDRYSFCPVSCSLYITLRLGLFDIIGVAGSDFSDILRVDGITTWLGYFWGIHHRYWFMFAEQVFCFNPIQLRSRQGSAILLMPMCFHVRSLIRASAERLQQIH